MGKPGSIEDIRPFAEIALNATTAVFKAYQESLDRFVLLKRLRPAFSGDEDLAARFKDEARIAARIQHPNVVAIYSFGSDEEGAYFVGEFVDGMDLRKLISRSRMPPDLALYILDQAARGLKAAHERNVLHRDLKPSNILVSRKGEVKLSDFGLASVSSTTAANPREIRGTLAYFAPEQILSSEVDERSDLFSLGATFFEMLTGRRAFHGATVQETFDAILNSSPAAYLTTWKSLDTDIKAICTRLLDREPSQRFSGADELLEHVEACRQRRGVEVDAGVLSAFLDDPASIDDRASSQARPQVEIAPENGLASDGPVWRTRRHAGIAVVVLLGLIGLAYAVLTISDTADNDSSGAAAELRDPSGVLQETVQSIAAELGVVDTTLLARFRQGASAANGDAASPPRTTSSAASGAGMVAVTSRPATDVYVGGESVGTTAGESPLFIRLAVGEHAVSLRHPEFPRHDRVIQVAAGQTTYLDVDLASTAGRLHLRVSPWADVYVDGQYLGQEPMADPFVLEPGNREVRLVNPEMGVDTTFMVYVPAGDTLSHDVIL